MKPKLYLETSIVSYLTARPSHDLIRAAHQQVTRDWWETRSSFDLYISQFVLDEAKAGNAEAAGRRLSMLREASLLELTPETGRLAREILGRGGMPAKAYVDAVHVALAAVHGLDYLLTWNCAHIANATMRGKIEAICRATGFEPPVICTPIELVKEL
ncbi:MAG TPA: type II toxin-antitoxin system VapC family toxin [Thermoanaerobaculia bacterium]|jgi:predicted nucleic acid-binding protein